MFLSEALKVLGFGVERFVFPECEHDSDPLEGEGSDCGVVLHVLASFEVVEGFRPGAPLSSLVGEFMKGLFEEVGAEDPLRNDAGLTTALGNWSDSRE